MYLSHTLADEVEIVALREGDHVVNDSAARRVIRSWTSREKPVGWKVKYSIWTERIITIAVEI